MDTDNRSGPFARLSSIALAPASWPLRWLGLDPGRAIANARPDPRRNRRDRVEQFAYIAANLAAEDDLLAIVSGGGNGAGRDEVSIAVFDGDQLVTRHTELGTLLRDTSPGDAASATPTIDR